MGKGNGTDNPVQRGMKKGANSCPVRRLNSQKFENLVIDKIKQHILTTENLTKFVHIVNEEIDGMAATLRQHMNSVLDEIAVWKDSTMLSKPARYNLTDLAPRIQLLRQRQE